jgi:hypothetical protein
MKKIVDYGFIRNLSFEIEKFIKGIVQIDKEEIEDSPDQMMKSFRRAIDLIYKETTGKTISNEIKDKLFELWKTGKNRDLALMSRLIIAMKYVKLEKVDIIMEPYKGYRTIIKAGSSHSTIKSEILYYYELRAMGKRKNKK